MVLSPWQRLTLQRAGSHRHYNSYRQLPVPPVVSLRQATGVQSCPHSRKPLLCSISYDDSDSKAAAVPQGTGSPPQTARAHRERGCDQNCTHYHRRGLQHPRGAQGESPPVGPGQCAGERGSDSEGACRGAPGAGDWANCCILPGASRETRD